MTTMTTMMSTIPIMSTISNVDDDEQNLLGLRSTGLRFKAD
jgi:hypothetical protein